MNMLFSELDDTSGPPAYRVLARKYRPTRFDELIGQEALVRTLKNAIESGRLAQAWMLTGVRGIGKTTTARIIARSLNCVGADGKGGPTIEPCGTCPNCEAIAADRHVDVLEIDAASHTGVDNIRDVIDSVRYGPVSARYKVYIIDEVHMLSEKAFNALLKTLEEPPPHTKFIFATTEIRKVPVTVLSRCQRFDLKRVSSEALAAHFGRVAKAEGAEIDETALALIARAADGSVRDGLSLLDQAIARADGAVTGAEVQEMLGLADRARLVALFESLHTGNMAAALAATQELRDLGADPMVVLQDLADITHLLTRALSAPELLRDKSLPEMERKLAESLGQKLDVPVLARSWQMLLKGMQEVQYAPDAHKALEMVLIRLAHAANLPPPGELARMLQDSGFAGRDADKSLVNPPSGGAEPRTTHHRTSGNLALAAATPQPQIQAVARSEEATARLAQPQSFAALVQLFAENREPVLHGHLMADAHLVSFQPGRLEIRVAPRAPQNLAQRVSKALQEWTGARWMISLSQAEGAPTLAEEARAEKDSQRKRAGEHPLVRAALEQFPGARISAIRVKAKPVEAAPAAPDEEILVPTGEEEQTP